MDHDQRFKQLIKTFFREFLELFFADWASRLDLDTVEFLDKESFPNPPEGDRHLLDIVAKIRTREPIPLGGGNDPTELLALVHIEIEYADTTSRLKPRFKDYYLDLRREHGLPVLPIAIFLRVGLDGIGVESYSESFWELETLRVRFLYVGLPALDAVEYLRREMPLGWALMSLMRIPRERVQELGLEALRRIAHSPLDRQKQYLLAECVDAYLPLDETTREEFERLRVGSSDSGVQAMNKTFGERVAERVTAEVTAEVTAKVTEQVTAKVTTEVTEKVTARERDRYLEQYRRSARKVIEHRFRTVPPILNERINSSSWDEITEILARSAEAKSPDELLN